MEQRGKTVVEQSSLEGDWGTAATGAYSMMQQTWSIMLVVPIGPLLSRECWAGRYIGHAGESTGAQPKPVGQGLRAQSHSLHQNLTLASAPRGSGALAPGPPWQGADSGTSQQVRARVLQPWGLYCNSGRRGLLGTSFGGNAVKWLHARHRIRSDSAILYGAQCSDQYALLWLLLLAAWGLAEASHNESSSPTGQGYGVA